MTSKQRRKRDKCRETVCVGCRHNYYNWPKPRIGNDVAVPEDYMCWHLNLVKRGKCPCYSDNRT